MQSLSRPLQRINPDQAAHHPFASVQSDVEFKNKIDRSLANGAIERLAKCPALMDFMPQLIDRLGENPNSRSVESALHFLRGYVSYVPPGLPECQGLPAEVCKTLKELLNANVRHNSWLCCSATPNEVSPKKYIANFKELWTVMQLASGWEAWVNSADFPLSVNRDAKRNLLKEGVKQCREKYGETTSDIDRVKELVNGMPCSKYVEEWMEEAPRRSRLRADRFMISSYADNKTIGEKIYVSCFDISTLDVFEGYPKMPSVHRLDLNDCRISSLAGVPAHLRELSARDNVIESFGGMPEMPHLTRLGLSGNPITSFENMPEMPQLSWLTLMGSRISSLNGIPSSMLGNPSLCINLSDCPLDAVTIQSINERRFNNQPIRARILFNMAAHDGRADTSLADHPDVRRLLDQLKAQAPREHELSALKTLLRRLPGTACFKGRERDDSLAELVGILEEMVSDSLFREFCFTACGDADADCYDNVQSIFDSLRVERENPAYHEGSTLQDVVDFQRKRLNEHLLLDYVSKALGGRGDPLENQMLLQHELSKDNPDLFSISYKNILYGRASTVSNNIEGHKAWAKSYLMRNAADSGLIRQMAENPSCISYLKKHCAKEYEHFLEQWRVKFDESMKLPGNGNAHREGMAKIESALKKVQETIFSSPSSSSKAALDALLKKLPHFGDGKLFTEIQKLAEKVWAREMAEKALNEAKTPPDDLPEMEGLHETDSPVALRKWQSSLSASKSLFSSR